MHKYWPNVILLVCIIAPSLQAQGTLKGKVLAANSAPAEGVTVTATNVATLASFTAVSGPTGEFELGNLRPSQYTITAQSSNLGRAVLPPVKFTGQTMSVIVRLDGASVNTTRAPSRPVAPSPRYIQPKLELQDLTRSLQETFDAKKEPELTSVLQQLFAASKAIPNAYQSAVEYFYKNNEFEHALKICELGIKEDKKNSTTFRRKTAELQIILGQYDAAAKLVQALLKENPSDPFTLQLNQLVKLYVGTQADRALQIKAIEAELIKAPTNSAYHFNLARALLAQGDGRAARSHFESAIDFNSGFLPSRIGLAQLLLEYKEWSNALNAASKVLAFNGKNIPGLLVHSGALIGAAEYKQARHEIDEILKLDPNSFDARYQSGVLDLKEKNLDTADNTFRQLKQVNPSDLRPITALAEVLRLRGKPIAAVEFLKKEFAANPKQIQLLSYLVDLAVNEKMYSEATSANLQLIALDPGNPNNHFQLAGLYMAQKDDQNALLQFRQAALLAPDNSRILIELATHLERLHQRSEVGAIYEKILGLDPYNVVALNNLAVMLTDLDSDLDKALSLANRALAIRPRDPEIIDTVGMILIKKKLYDKAVKIFLEVTLLNPTHPNISGFQYHLGQAYLGMGNKVLAKKALQAALEAKPTEEDRQQIQTLLQSL